MFSPRFMIIAVSAVTALGGCASSKSGDVYSRDQARQEMTVRMGVVESVRPVALEGTRSGVGTMAGGAVGGVAGSSVGGGKGQIVGAILGAVAGGIAGNALENQTTKKEAMELTVTLDNGQTIAIVQEGDAREFQKGDRVRVLSRYGETRVTH